MRARQLVPPQCRSSRQISTGFLSAASSMRDCTSWRSQNKNSDEAWTSLSARRSASGGSPSNNASKRAPSSMTRPGSAAPRPTRNESSASHRYALVEQPRLAEPGAALHHDYATGPSPDLAQPPANDRELLLTSAEGRTERSVHISQEYSRDRSDPLNSHGSTLRSGPVEQRRQAAARPIPALHGRHRSLLELAPPAHRGSARRIRSAP